MLTKSIVILFFLIALKDVGSHGVDASGGGPHGERSHGERPHEERPHGGRFPIIPRLPFSREAVCSEFPDNFGGLFADPGHPPDAPYVCSVCTNSTTFATCAINASRCYPRFTLENDQTAHAAFCDCKNSLPDVAAYYTEWVNSTIGAMDTCITNPMSYGRPHGGDHGNHGGNHGDNRGDDRHGNHPVGFRPPHPHLQMAINHTDFMQSLNASDPILLASFECCISKKTGLFDSNGVVDVAALKSKAEAKPDGMAEMAIANATLRCATPTTICSIHSLLHCIVADCFAALQTSSG